MVKNEPNFVLTVSPNELPDIKSDAYKAIISQLALTTKQSETDITSIITEHSERLYYQPLVLRDFIPYSEALNLITQYANVSGVYIQAQPTRSYLHSEALAHVLGYIGKISSTDLDSYDNAVYSLSDLVGKTGLEQFYETELRGKRGERRIEIDAQGRKIDVLSEEAAVPGDNLVLNIDAELQQNFYDTIAQKTAEVGSPGGTAIALDPRTGQIRALVSYPSYDANAFVQGINIDDYTKLTEDERKPLFNKAIAGEYPSGSTFKLIVASAALQERVISDNTTVQSVGGVKIGQRIYEDWKKGGHGTTDINKALAESVNSFFYLAGGGTYNEDTQEITGGLGIDRIHSYAEMFGLGQRTGIDLAGEAGGFVPDRDWKKATIGEDWFLGDTYIVSIGQGDLRVTPLQVAMYTSVIANGGTLYRPQLVERRTDQYGNTVKTIEPTVVRENFIDPAYIETVRRGMHQAVMGSTGSARRMQSLGIDSAGKTGTAQIGGSEDTHSWYTTFLPYDNPELVVTVLIEKTNGPAGEGSAAALSVAQTVLTNYYANKP
ncbi:MAG: hypothetical protein ACD_43C00070G0001 [uncultured bacterium]|nr:MAG: hypothetical protein ACD_43C00070G0001 [uncultured bacterium]